MANLFGKWWLGPVRRPPWWSYVEPALDSASRAFNPHEQIAELYGVAGEALFDDVLGELAKARLIAERLAAMRDEERDLALAAATALFPASAVADPQEHAEHVLGMFLALADLEIDRSSVRQRKRGRPIADIRVRSVVRASMHYLYDTGKQMNGGWKEANRKGARMAKRRSAEEWETEGAAAFVIGVVAQVGLPAEISAIKQHMDTFTKELKDENRGPAREDYVISQYDLQQFFKKKEK